MAKNIFIFFHKLRYYGFRVAFFNLLDSQKNKFRIFYNAVNENKHRAILDWLNKNFSCLILKYKQKDKFDLNKFDGTIPRLIWICWWDGIEAMPPIIRACYQSVLMNSNGFKVTVITKNNYKNYLSFPNHIMDKFNNGVITITHLSDIIRMYLLNKYGGLWLDATVLVTNSIDINNKSFFTIRDNYGSDNVAKNRWAGNCIGGISGFILFDFIYSLMSEYWKKFNDMVDYFLIDYTIALAYSFIPMVKKTIDNIQKEDKYSGSRYMFMQSCLKKELDMNIFNQVIRNSVFHKLVWKENIPIVTSGNKFTIYGYIIKKYSEQ